MEKTITRFGVIFSQKEFSRISTIEDLIDTIVLHRRFKNLFISSSIRNIPLDFDADESFDLETMTREVEKMYGITVARDSITTAEDLRKYISENGTIYNSIVSILSEKLDVLPEEVIPSSNIIRDLGADSLDIFDLITECEKTFEIQITDEEALKINTVEDVYKMVITKKSFSVF